MTEKKIPVPKAGETAEQYHQRLIAAGFASPEPDAKLQDDKVQTDRTISDKRYQALVDQFMSAVPETGTIGNITLRERLTTLDADWATDLYTEIRQYCIDQGLLKPGRGRGGSVSRAQQNTPAEPEAINEQDSPAASAEKLYRQAAEKGNADAQFALATQLQKTGANASTRSEALKWMLKAAEQGRAVAQYELAKMYHRGWAGEENKGDNYLKWLRLAAGSRYAPAQCDLGLVYENGSSGVDEDKHLALKLFLASANQGYADAQFHLALAYGSDDQEMLPVAKNPEEEVRWLRMAANQACYDAIEWLTQTYESGDYLPEDPGAAFNVLLKAAEGGDVVAQYLVSWRYRNSEDWSSAARWSELAAEQGHPAATLDSAYCYEHGIGVEKNLDDAHHWYLRAILQEKCVAIDDTRDGNVLLDATAHALRLAGMYHEAENYLKAREIYEAACKVQPDDYDGPTLLTSAFDGTELWLDIPGAMLMLGEYCRLGLGTPVDIKQAVFWYRQAASNGNEEAICALGIAYLDGVGVPANTVAGYALLKLAEEAGNEEAAEVLSKRAKTEGRPKGAEKLAAQMSKPDNFLEALDKHIDKSLARGKADK